MALAEHTKQARIAVILDAAERLIRRGAGTQFSMRALADEAGVSPATPFNLLGSKAQILQALFARSFDMPEGQHPDQLAGAGADVDAIDIIFAICDVILHRYADDAAYHRTLLVGVGTSFQPLLAAIAGWHVWLQFAVGRGALRRDVHVQSLAETLEFSFAGTIAFWITKDISSERLLPQVEYAVAATLLGFATPSSQPRLHKRLRAAARALKALGPLVQPR